jgi:hypothetical protein
MASAGIGALMEGLDRPGKSGIGFDAKAGLEGGMRGYTIGKGTQLVKGGAKALMSQMGTGGVPSLPPAPSQVSLTPKAMPNAPSQVSLASKYPTPSFSPSSASLSANAMPSFPSDPIMSLEDIRSASNAVSKLAPKPMGLNLSVPSLSTNYADYAVSFPSGMSSGDGSSLMSRIGRGVSTGMDWAEKHPIMSQGIIKGISSALPNQETAALAEKNRLTQRQLDLEERQYNEEQERRKRIAQLLLPMYQQMAPKMFGQTTP